MTTMKDLKSLPQWLCWKYEIRDGKETKIPYQVNGLNAKSNDSSTWNNYQDCVNAVKVMDYSGVGFVFSKDDPYIGIDIDDCISDDGIHPKALQIITHLNSYAEISPSETGVKLWIKDEGNIVDLRKKQFSIGDGMNVEVYRVNRYFTVTDNVFDDSPLEINEAGAELNEIIDMYVSKDVAVFDDDYTSGVIMDGEQAYTTEECKTYLDNQIAKAVYKIRNMTDGTKHRTRYLMGRLVGGAIQAVVNAGYEVSKEEIVAIADKLFDANPPSGNDRQEYQAIRDGIRAGKESPTRIQHLARKAPQVDSELPVNDNSLVSRINKYYNGLHDIESLSHFDLADLFIHLYSDELRYNNETRSWYRWRGNVWVQGAQKSNHVPVSFAGKMMTAVYEYGALIPDEKYRAKYMTTAFRMKTASSLEAIARMAEANIAAESGTKKKSKGFFDIEKSREYKDYITVGNGIVNLSTGELLPYNKDWCFTKMTSVEYHPGVKSEKFEEFIRQIFLDRTELINYVQSALGYSLTGRSGIQALFFCVGVGSNGKGTLFEILRNLYGDYYNKTEATAFILDLKKSSNAANPFVAELMDTRIAVGDEYPSGTQMDNALVKNVTGSTTLRGRMLNENPISFNPTHSMWFLSNYLPEMKQQDDGIWRRFKIIPFDYKIEKNTEKEMTDFVASFNSELTGILNWIVEGSIKMIASGKLPYCAIVEQLNDEFRIESDRVAEFITVCCDVDRSNQKDYWVSKKLAYRVWDMWKNEVGERMTMTAKTFSREITSNRSTMGFKYGKRNDDYFLGFRIKPEYLRNIYDMDVEKLNGFGRKDLDEEEPAGFKPNKIIQMPARNAPIPFDDVADDTF